MAYQFPNLVTNGYGIELQGLCYNPFSSVGASFFVVDGLGLQTGGLVWNLNNSWAPTFQPVAVTWTGCTTLCVLNG